MKRILPLLALFATLAVSSCSLLDIDDDDEVEQEGGTAVDEPTVSIESALQLERNRAVVLPDEELRVGFTLRIDTDIDGERPIDLRYEVYGYDSDRYAVDMEQESLTSGTLVIRGIDASAGYAPSEVWLRVDDLVTGASSEAVLRLDALECSWYDAPTNNLYAAPAQGGVVELVVECNTTTLLPLTVTEEWIEYDPAESEVEELADGYSIQVHRLHVLPHGEGSEPRETEIALLSAEGFIIASCTIGQEVDFEASGREMILRVRASAGNARTVYLPLYYIEECTIDWGDGKAERFEQYNAYGTGLSHTYAEAGEYEVRISGRVSQIRSEAMPEAALTNCILAVVQWGNLGTEVLSMRDITSLESVAPDTQGAFGQIHTFDRTFLRCTGLTELPEGLFAGATAAVTFEATFYGCTGLTTLPDGLFEKCGATTFDSVFAGCTGLTSLPADLFRGCTDAYTFHATFEECTGLTELPEELFAHCPDVINFTAVFNRCTGLTELPEGLFAANPRANFRGETVYYPGSSYIEERGLFSGCTGLTELPEGLFAANTQASDLSMAFLGCTGLKHLPAGLFASNAELTDVTSTFERCTALEEVPAGLFDGNTRLEDVSSLFEGCKALRSVPVDIFDNCRLILQCYYTFGWCPLEGESPYTEIDGVKYHLYERSENPIEFTVPAGNSCFTGCTSLDDYEAIPETWR